MDGRGILRSLPVLIVNDDLLKDRVFNSTVKMTDAGGNLDDVTGVDANGIFSLFLVNPLPGDTDDSHSPMGMPAAVASRFEGNDIGLRNLIDIISLD